MAKETDSMMINKFLVRMKVGPLAFLVTNSFNCSMMFENHTHNIFMLFLDIIHVTCEILKATGCLKKIIQRLIKY